MVSVKPAYYDKFRCIGGACDFTCCQEWKIAVDDATNKKWKDIKPPKGTKTRRKNLSLFTKFKDGQRVIALEKDHKCPFLDENKLCRLVIDYGEEMISETCHVFPREIHEFEDRKEYTLMPCCPVTIDYLNAETFSIIMEGEEEAEDENRKELCKLRSAFMEIQGEETYSLEEGLLTNFYLLLDEYQNWCEKEEERYSMSRTKEELLGFGKEIKATIEGLSFDEEGGFAECNELFLDLVDNYRKEGMYQSYLDEPVAFAEAISTGEDSYEGLVDIVNMTYEDFKDAWNSYEKLFRNYLVQEYYADLLIPGSDLEGAVVKLQWISMEYVAIRHLCFLSWKLKGSLDYQSVRDYIVMVSRMMGYEEDDIYEYMENSFEELIWDWGYMALMVGK